MTRINTIFANLTEYFLGDPDEYTRMDLVWFYGFIVYSILITAFVVLY